MRNSDRKSLPARSYFSLAAATQTAVFLLATILLIGCADERQQVADWIAPPTAVETLDRMGQQVAVGKLSEAIRIGEAFVAEKTGAGSAEVHSMLARLLIEQGDAIGSLRHLHEANFGSSAPVVVTSGGATYGPTAEAPQPPETPLAKKSTQPSLLIPDVSATVGDVSASVTGGKVEARAGNVSARVLP